MELDFSKSITGENSTQDSTSLVRANSWSPTPLGLTVALVAHDNTKEALLSWAASHISTLRSCNLVATGNTGSLLKNRLDLEVFCVKSGPLGGDQQIGSMVADGMVDALIFFWDPLTSQPHDPDVKALLRLAVLNDVLTACSLSTANAVMASLTKTLDASAG
jgi:methylglyoxal synthase